MNVRHIEIFAKTNNQKGDLFCRLMGDFFHAIGYDKPRFDIQKSGREIDLTTIHRTENKIAVAECKAHDEKIGGSDINKFVGSLDAEKKNPIKNILDSNVIGYFVSLSGFKETAIEQEESLKEKRLILIDKEKIISELVAGKIIVPIENAISNVKYKEEHPDLLNEFDLIAHKIGWIWVLYYGVNNTITHFSFVHAEGKPLLDSLSEDLIEFDNTGKKLFKGLTYLKPVIEFKDSEQKREKAKQLYYQYIQNECGNIQFEGLPTDKEVGSVKVELERIFLPLHLERSASNIESKNKVIIDTPNKIDTTIRKTIGEILKNDTRLAILAKPGGGKSTLLKRIAVAYAFHERRDLVDDNLPDEKWVPIFLRCRELGDYVTKSITEIIENIPNRAEIGFCKEGFSAMISDSLQNGNALLLIDGLDEISEDNNRLLFVNQLRTFLATYPNIHIIITSREAGFRVIGGALSGYCNHYKISNLMPDEILELTIKWHIAIVDNTEKTISDAKDLAKLILKDKRIQVLAENPLLLTTLLFVKRWAGYIPTKKSVLYDEMIKLLLVTWNVEGHEQLDIDETEPQLAFVAFWMTEKGEQTISYEDLKNCLIKSRKEMPDILGYTKVNISDFIKRVESRSSLLILSGHKKLSNGSTTPIYEFLHLSFQEYLTAKAVVEKYLPQNLSNNSSLDIIRPHIEKENWKEVIPLIAVLSKRGTNELIEFLIEESKKIILEERIVTKQSVVLPPELLGSCIANEIQINPILLKIAIEWFAKNWYHVHRDDLIEIIAHSKFSKTFFETIHSLFFNVYEDKFIAPLGGLLGTLNIFRIQGNKFDTIKGAILSNIREEKCIGILSLMMYAYNYQSREEGDQINKEKFQTIENELFNSIRSDDKHLNFASCWSIAWLCESSIFYSDRKIAYYNYLLRQWLDNEEKNFSRIAVWAFFSMLDASISLKEILPNDEFASSLFDNKIKNPKSEYDKIISYYVGSSLGYLYDKKEMEMAFNEIKGINIRVEKFYMIGKFLDIEIKDRTQIVKM